MRCAAGAGLLLLVGCNQIFGITATQPWDAPVDVIADRPHVALTWQIAVTSPSGGPAAALVYPPFEPASAPAIRLATLDGPFQPADYSSDPLTPGWIQVPRSYFVDGKPWRLEYTLPGGVPHEVQWTPQDKLGHLTAPMVGRLERQAVPVGGGYTVTANNGPASYMSPRVITTGLWTDGEITAMTGNMIDYDFFNAVSLSGLKGRPDPAQGDRAFVVDYAVDSPTGCRVANGSAALTQVALSAGVHTAQTVPWDATTKSITSDPVDWLAVIDRFTTGLGPLHVALNDALSILRFGIAPSADFPGFAGTSAFVLPSPVMQTLLQCPYRASPLPKAAVLLDDFPHILHVQIVDSRAVLGVSLSSGLAAVIGTSSTGGFKIVFPAPLPTKIKLATPSMGILDLAGAADQLAAGPAGGAFTLTFTPEAGADMRADYHDVVLHRIAGGELTPVRIYTVTAAEVRIDGAQLLSNTDYVLEIRTYKGHVMASRGDFAPVDYPYGAAIVFTRTFRTS